jgi:hypothetical protein
MALLGMSQIACNVRMIGKKWAQIQQRKGVEKEPFGDAVLLLLLGWREPPT